MSEALTFATKLPRDLVEALNRLCAAAGLRKNRVVEMALREKIEEMSDIYDLHEAMQEGTRFFTSSQAKKRVPS
ncbi:MAG: hypothetical protein RDV41_14915, partial [Planctomycetota bacterium]|nr:hypothetical protein [Planctomycetota bacterium]